MKTTIDLPDDLLERTKIAAAQRRTTLKRLVIEGLEGVLRKLENPAESSGALQRLERGYHLGGEPLNRNSTHAR